MVSLLNASLLCRRKEDKKLLCVCPRGSQGPYELFSVSVSSEGSACDELREAAFRSLDFQIFRLELTSSSPINGSSTPPIIVYKLSFLIQERLARRIQEKASLQVKFLSVEELLEEHTATKETIEILSHISS